MILEKSVPRKEMDATVPKNVALANVMEPSALRQSQTNARRTESAAT